MVFEKENLERTKKFSDEILGEWDLVGLKEGVENEMKKWGFEEKVKEMRSRFDGYREIVLGEF